MTRHGRAHKNVMAILTVLDHRGSSSPDRRRPRPRTARSHDDPRLGAPRTTRRSTKTNHTSIQGGRWRRSITRPSQMHDGSDTTSSVEIVEPGAPDVSIRATDAICRSDLRPSRSDRRFVGATGARTTPGVTSSATRSPTQARWPVSRPAWRGPRQSPPGRRRRHAVPRRVRACRADRGTDRPRGRRGRPRARRPAGPCPSPSAATGSTCRPSRARPWRPPPAGAHRGSATATIPEATVALLDPTARTLADVDTPRTSRRPRDGRATTHEDPCRRRGVDRAWEGGARG